MKRKVFARNEEAVSPVIGVILMVAITVILAAVIASFVFGLGSKAPKSAPQAQLAISDYTDTLSSTTGEHILTISHQGGDALTCGNSKILISYRNDTVISVLTFNSTAHKYNTNTTDVGLWSDSLLGDDRFDPGDVVVIKEGAESVESGDILKIKVIDTISNQPILDGQVQVW